MVLVIRRVFMRLGATTLSAVQNDGQVKISVSFVPEPLVDSADLVRRAQREPHRYVVTPSGKLGIIVTGAQSGDREFLRVVRHEVGQLKVA
ncbi:MAG: hypothetical protein AAF654_11245 [Myxococcota bacterium]